jgi:Ca-activated chloride channel family protein
MRANAAILESADGQHIALESVIIEGTLQDLLAEVTVTQDYLNTESVTIEAVYTFPLPLDATLLALNVTLGDRTLRGIIVEKTEAEEQYEEAVIQGDSAIMLQQAGPGLYTMNLGNLQPGEAASIQFRYAVLQCWNGDDLRFMLPTTIAPRYGQPTSLAPHQTPKYTLSVDLTYSLRIQVQGILAHSHITSPSHAITQSTSKEGVLIQLATGMTALDRDFVLNFHHRASSRLTALAQADFDGYVALASFKPELGHTQDPSPRSIKLVIDCSGSMGGGLR